jgi:hypothetical protein
MINIQVVALGGSGIQGLKDLFVKDDLDSVSATLKDYAATITPENAPPVEYITELYQSFGAPDPNSLPVAHRDQVLGTLYLMSRDAEATRDRLHTLLRADPNSDIRKLISSDQLSKYKDEYKQYRDFVNTIYATAKECLADETKCSDQIDEPDQVLWPDVSQGNPNLDAVTCTKNVSVVGVQIKIELKVGGVVSGEGVKRIEFVRDGNVVDVVTPLKGVGSVETPVSLVETVWKLVGSSDTVDFRIRVTDRFGGVHDERLAQ